MAKKKKKHNGYRNIGFLIHVEGTITVIKTIRLDDNNYYDEEDLVKNEEEAVDEIQKQFPDLIVEVVDSSPNISYDNDEEG